MEDFVKRVDDIVVYLSKMMNLDDYSVDEWIVISEIDFLQVRNLFFILVASGTISNLWGAIRDGCSRVRPTPG